MHRSGGAARRRARRGASRRTAVRPRRRRARVGPAAVVAAAREAIAAAAGCSWSPGSGRRMASSGASRGTSSRCCAPARTSRGVGPDCMGVAVPTGASAWIGASPTGTSAAAASPASCTRDRSARTAPCRPSFRPARGHVERQRDRAGRVRLAGDARGGRRDHGDRARARNGPAPAAFAEGLALAARAEKPVIVLANGRSPAASRAALAHSGAVVGSAQALAALCSAHGAITVDDVPSGSSAWRPSGSG